MENFTIYPAIDLRGGIVVRLRQGKMDQQTDYSNSPSDVAVEWMSNGAQWIHVVNLDGAFGETSSKNMLAIQSIITLIKNKVDIQLDRLRIRCSRSGIDESRMAIRIWG